MLVYMVISAFYHFCAFLSVAVNSVYKLQFFMAALRSRCGHYIFALWFLSIYLSFFPHLISAHTPLQHYSNRCATLRMHGRVWLQTPHPVNAENAEADVANRNMTR